MKKKKLKEKEKVKRQKESGQKYVQNQTMIASKE